MNPRVRPFLICLLVLSLLSLGWLNGRGMALAQTGAMVVEICAAGSKQTVTLAANGDIIDATTPGDRSQDVCNHCPDCMLPLAMALADLPQQGWSSGRTSRAIPVFAKTQLLTQAQTLPRVRAPPQKA